MDVLLGLFNFIIFMILMFGIVTFLGAVLTVVDKRMNDEEEEREDTK